MRGYIDPNGHTIIRTESPGYYVLLTEDEVADMVPDDFDKDISDLCDELTRYWQDNMQEHIIEIIDWIY